MCLKYAIKQVKKLHALSRVCRFMGLTQRNILMQAFIHSQFGYCPLVWMFHSRKLNCRINNIHERALHLVYNDSVSSFEESLRKYNSYTIHMRNIQALGIELYRVANGISPKIMSIVFPLKENTRYPSENEFNVRTVKYVTDKLVNNIKRHEE